MNTASTEMSTDLEQACRDEVAGLHEFFTKWYNAELPETPEAFARFEQVMGDGFELILPGGECYCREKTLLLVQYGHGSAKRSRTPEEPLRIWPENHRHRITVGDLALVTYEEWHVRNGETQARLSTALFRRREDTPNGVEWLHVHETWLPAPAREEG